MKLRIIPLMVAAMIVATPAIANAQAANNDPALQQVVSADEAIAPAGEHTVIDAGHVDLGATFNGDTLEFLARDDTQQPPVWRHLDDVVFRVTDAAKQTLPDGDDFAFTGAKPGADVWVIPQTEVAGVPWLGWNTQAASLLEHSGNGVSLEFGGHEGPGEFSLFLQPGGFHAPQLLWTTTEPGAQPMWVEPNTHTHANWVFTEPGVHLVGVRAVVKDDAGTVHTDEQLVRVAVGDGTDVVAAQSAQFNGPWREGAASEEQADSQSTLNAGLIAGGVIGVLLLALVALLVARSRKGRRA